MKLLYFKKTYLLLCLFMAGMGSVWAQETVYTKWKQVQDPAILATGDVVVIVDLTSKNAMKNNPEYEEGNTVSKAVPPALKVTLKEELDRITSDVGDTIVWTADRTDSKYAFKSLYDQNNGNTRYLFNSDQNLRVGYVSSNDAWKRKFDLDNGLLFMGNIEVDENQYKDYHIGLKVASGLAAMMSGSTWELMADSVDANDPSVTYVNKEIAATKTAFFKKVETTLPDPTLHFPGHDYEADINGSFTAPVAVVDEDASATITYWSGNENMAMVDATTGAVTVKKRGTVRIYAQVEATATYDNYLTSYVLRIDDTSNNVKGCRTNPFTVAEAIAYAKEEGHEEETADGVCYFVKGIVSSVGGGMEGMEDMMSMMSGMMEGMEGMEGFDMNAMMSMFMGEQVPGTVTYAISDNGVNRDSLSIINGYGLILVDITTDSLSVGDEVTAYGQLEYSEDNDMMSMMSGMGGSGGNNEPKKSVKMPRVNYMQEHTRNLITQDVALYYEQTKSPDDLYSITKLFGGTQIMDKTTLTPSDKDVADWVVNGTDSLLTPKKEGIIYVTVYAPVLLSEGDTIKMKRRFVLDVRDRRLLPAGTMVGNYELVTDASQLQNGDKLLVVATIDNKPKVLTKGSGGGGMMAMFGGGGNSSNITINDDGKITEVPDDARILTLEQDGDKWRLQTGRTTDYEMTYLYSSDSGSGNGFGGMAGMGGSGASLKTGKYDAVMDCCQVSFTFHAEKNDSVTIKYNFADREKDGETVKAKNVIRFEKSMMSSSFGGYEEDSEKATLPRLYRLVQADQYDITITSALWATIVSAYDVNLPEGLTGCTVKALNPETHKASMNDVTSLKAGEPYLLKADSPGVYTLTRNTEGVAKPDINLLKISDNTTGNGAFVLANKSKGVGFYKWSGGLLGSGRVYLEASGASMAPAFYNFDFDTATSIEKITKDTEPSTIYDLSGRRVAQPTKGLYIVDGKKAFVK